MDKREQFLNILNFLVVNKKSILCFVTKRNNIFVSSLYHRLIAEKFDQPSNFDQAINIDFDKNIANGCVGYLAYSLPLDEFIELTFNDFVSQADLIIETDIREQEIRRKDKLIKCRTRYELSKVLNGEIQNG